MTLSTQAPPRFFRNNDNILSSFKIPTPGFPQLDLSLTSAKSTPLCTTPQTARLRRYNGAGMVLHLDPFASSF